MEFIKIQLRQTIHISLVILILCIGLNPGFSQKIYTIDASQPGSEIKSGILKMGNPGQEGKEILVNSHYLSLGGKPIIPVMGEVHYSRIPKEQWEDVILKMKACGITIIASYALWIHHEEIEGQFEWSGNKDIRSFARLCQKHGVYLYPRIGPWCHAEVRNGGTPDWILTKSNINDRSNDPVYQFYADRWYQQVALQLKGLLYKDGGPIIGIQLENEYRRGRGGEAHIMWLKETAKKYGLDVPMYTVTGWQNGSVPPYEVIPLWGGYPDAPWADNISKKIDCSEFQFKPYRDSDGIGNNVQKEREQYIDYSAYPYFTCEVGVGIMNTDHRRLIIGPKDGLGLILTKIGSGSNLPGYYMFAGGSNPQGVLTTLEENKEETGYYNSNPIISYDFQAAIRESGKLNKPYYQVKKIHYFLREFGTQLAIMSPSFPEQKTDLQYSVRSDGNSAYLFGINYCRHQESAEIEKARFKIKLQNETITFPNKSISIKDSAMFMWPLNFKINTTTLKYATAQPLCNIGNKWVFIEDAISSPEFCFDNVGIENISVSNGNVENKKGQICVTDLQPSKDCIITITANSGEKSQIIILSKEEALNTWLFGKETDKHLFITHAGMYENEKVYHVFDTSNNFTIYKLNAEISEDKAFTSFDFTTQKRNIQIKIDTLLPLRNAAWLKTNAVDKLDNKSILRHRFFLKEFSLNNPSSIKNAHIIIYPESKCNIQLNNNWVNTEIETKTLNSVDITGYVKKGDNKLLLDFPFEDDNNAFAAEVIVEYYNANRISFATNQSWLMRDDYNFPSYLTNYNKFSAPKIVQGSDIPSIDNIKEKSFSLKIQDGYLDDLNNLYLNINYTGDKGKLYYNHQLIADDFYNGTTWEIGLNRLRLPLENKELILKINPLPENARVYFDDDEVKIKATKAHVTEVKAIPEYHIDLEIKDGALNLAK